MFKSEQFKLILRLPLVRVLTCNLTGRGYWSWLFYHWRIGIILRTDLLLWRYSSELNLTGFSQLLAIRDLETRTAHSSKPENVSDNYQKCIQRASWLWYALSNTLNLYYHNQCASFRDPWPDGQRRLQEKKTMHTIYLLCVLCIARFLFKALRIVVPLIWTGNVSFLVVLYIIIWYWSRRTVIPVSCNWSQRKERDSIKYKYTFFPFIHFWYVLTMLYLYVSLNCS